jgi:putative oxidoreductase
MRNASHMLAAALRWGLGAVLLYAGLAKLGAARVFAADIVRLQLVPFQWAEFLAAILPIAELLTGCWLIAGWRPRAAALATILLAASFVFAASQAMARGLDFNCHCFGVATDSPPTWVVLGRASLLLGLAAWLYLRAAIAGRSTPRPQFG